MRLPGTKIWRAFPELDPYTEEECQRYGRQAVMRRFVGIIILAPIAFFAGLAIGLTVYVGLVIALTAAGINFDSVSMPDWVAIPLALIAFLIVLVPPFLCCLLARDYWLRRAIRARLDRAVCDGCQYSLLGLVPLVDEATRNDAVRCPECGTLTPLDGSRLSHDDLMPHDPAPPTAG